MSDSTLYIAIPDSALRWDMKRAALEQRTTVRQLALAILRSWLADHGYGDERQSMSDGARQAVGR